MCGPVFTMSSPHIYLPPIRGPVFTMSFTRIDPPPIRGPVFKIILPRIDPSPIPGPPLDIISPRNRSLSVTHSLVSMEMVTYINMQYYMWNVALIHQPTSIKQCLSR